MNYRCRMVVPKKGTDWTEVAAGSPADAVQEFHVHGDDEDSLWHFHYYSPSQRCQMLFARIEVEGHGSFVSRCIREGLWRGGGVQLPKPSPVERLAVIAERLEWKHAPEELVSDEKWIGVETHEEAAIRVERERKEGQRRQREGHKCP